MALQAIAGIWIITTRATRSTASRIRGGKGRIRERDVILKHVFMNPRPDHLSQIPPCDDSRLQPVSRAGELAQEFGMPRRVLGQTNPVAKEIFFVFEVNSGILHQRVDNSLHLPGIASGMKQINQVAVDFEQNLMLPVQLFYTERIFLLPLYLAGRHVQLSGGERFLRSLARHAR